MIDRREILDVARDLGLQAQVVEKDYVLGWLLAGIYRQERLHGTWVFKGGTCLKKSYFETYPGVWRHGDWLQLNRRPESVTAVIYGRSDSTINRHGIRMGTSELYRVVEEFDEVADSLVVDLEYLGRESFLALFVVSCREVPGGMPGTYDVETRWTAVAPRDGAGDGPFGRALCNEMLAAIEGAVTGPAFQNLATVPGAVWALVGSPQRTPIPRARRSSDARVDLSLPLTATLFG